MTQAVKPSQINRDAVLWENNDSHPIAQTQNHIPTPLPRYTPAHAPPNNQSHVRTQSSTQSEGAQEPPAPSQDPLLKITTPFKRRLLFTYFSRLSQKSYILPPNLLITARRSFIQQKAQNPSKGPPASQTGAFPTNQQRVFPVPLPRVPEIQPLHSVKPETAQTQLPVLPEAGPQKKPQGRRPKVPPPQPPQALTSFPFQLSKS